MFALAAVNSSSVSAPEACNCARCSSSSAGSAGGGAYCAWSWLTVGRCLVLIVVGRCLVVGLLLFPGLFGLVVSYRRPGNERAAPCPPSESHGKLLPGRPAVIDGG